MTRTEARLANLPYAHAATRNARASRIEDYLFIGGPRLPDRQAAQRLGLSVRTIERYPAALREAP